MEVQVARKKKAKVKAQEEKIEEEIESSADEEEAEAEADRDELAELRSELEETKAQATEYLNGWQRAQAEFANYRKRQEAEWAQMRARATADVLQKILPAVDDFERALSASPDDMDQSTWRAGIIMIKAKLDTILESEGVTSIETAGQPFDPTYHEAVTYEEADGYEEGQIIGEVQKGYMLGERILRPALVRVAKAPLSPSEENGNADEDKEE
jgi:molecular chaperone GrpE